MRAKTPEGKYLRKVIRLLEDCGWCKGATFKYNHATGHTEYCILGALNHEDRPHSNSKYTPIVLLLSDKIKEAVPTWNDAYARTKEDVLLLLEETYLDVENGG